MTATIRPQLSIATLAEQWDVAPGTVRALLKRGELVGVKIGGTIRISPASVDAYLSRHVLAPPAPSPAKAAGRGDWRKQWARKPRNETPSAISAEGAAGRANGR
jgi:excisionase family DNA binding protein